MPAAEETEGPPWLWQKLTTGYGVVTITAGAPANGGVASYTTFRVWVEGREVLSTAGIVLRVRALIPEPSPEGGTLVLLESEDGGNACEMLFHLLRLRPDGPPQVSREFGTCAGPEITVTPMVMRMRFEPSVPLWVQREPGFQMPPGEIWEFRAGRLVKAGTFRSTEGRE